MDASTLGPTRNPNLRFMGATWELSERPEIIGEMYVHVPGEMVHQSHQISVIQAICDLHCVAVV